VKLDEVEAHCAGVLEAVHARQFGNAGRMALERGPRDVGRDHRVAARVEGQHDVMNGEAHRGAQQPAGRRAILPRPANIGPVNRSVTPGPVGDLRHLRMVQRFWPDSISPIWNSEKRYVCVAISGHDYSHLVARASQFFGAPRPCR